MSPKESASPHDMIGMLMAGVLSQALAVMAELDIADLLIGGPKSAAELAAEVNVQPEYLQRVLRLTASHGVFRDTGDGRFDLTPLAELLRSDVPHSTRAAARLIHIGARAYPFMLDNLRTGNCALTTAFGEPIFSYLGKHPEDANVFDAAMSGFHAGETEAALEAYALARFDTICDVGCGAGSVIAATLQMYPSMHAILFDLPHVIERTRANMQAAGVAARCRFESGSFFETSPAGAEVYTIRHVIHDWQDAECIQILGTIRNAMKPGAKLLVQEAVVPEGNDPHFAKLADILMMLWPNGLERTAREYDSLLAAAGFEMTGITPTRSPVSVIEARVKA